MTEQGSQLVHKLVDDVRDYVTSPRKQRILMEDIGTWAQIGFCLYTLTDAQLAIDAFEDERKKPSNQGERDPGKTYLRVYGLLQAFMLQQEAFDNLSEALGMNFCCADIEGLRSVKRIRNDVAGHPTKRGRGRGRSVSYHGIVQMSLSMGGFEVHDAKRDGSHSSRFIDLKTLISDSAGGITNCLDLMKEELKAEVDEHRREFRDEKLAAFLPETRDYHVSKLIEAAHGSSMDRQWAQASLQMIEGMIEDLREALEKRGQLGEVTEYELDQTTYPLRAIRTFLGMETEEEMATPDVEAVEIFGWYLRSKLGDLVDIAMEMDEDYERDADDE